jgi:hypothetical protein
MDLDHNENYSQGVFLWDYSGGKAIGNNSDKDILVDSKGVLIAGSEDNNIEKSSSKTYSIWKYMVWGALLGVIGTCIITILAIKIKERRQKAGS